MVIIHKRSNEGDTSDGWKKLVTCSETWYAAFKVLIYEAF
jgi:hypothetical protein